MAHLFIDRDSSLPPYVQLKEQIKLAYAVGQLRQGDVLPSVRALARQLGVGEAAIRRAYTDLRELGLLSTERRKCVTVNRDLAPPPNIQKLAAEYEAQCRRLLVWAKTRGLSTISFARLLLRKAIAEEAAQPSHVYVDASSRSAAQFADTIARSWEVKVAGASLQEFSALTKEEANHYTAILVNLYRYESVIETIGSRNKHVYPIKLKVGKRLINRIRRLPVGSRVLMVFADEDFTRMGRPIVESYRELVGTKWRFEPAPFGKLDLAALGSSGDYGLIIVSTHVWDRVSERAKRMPKVVQVQNELDMQSLEEVRIRAGILV